MSGFTEEGMFARYQELVARRDALYAKNEPLEQALAEANAEAERARIKAAAIAAEIDENFGGADWLALKKEIALLARNLGRPGGVLAAKE